MTAVVWRPVDQPGLREHLDRAAERDRHWCGNGVAPAAEAPCRSCGACCAYSPDWPRFTMEEDAALALIPPAYVNDSGAGMRCVGDRCTALSGEVGVSTSCSVYSVRPDVCRACEPGDAACRLARRHFGLRPAEPQPAEAASHGAAVLPKGKPLAISSPERSWPTRNGEQS